jgi:hypothetical protein
MSPSRSLEGETGRCVEREEGTLARTEGRDGEVGEDDHVPRVWTGATARSLRSWCANHARRKTPKRLPTEPNEKPHTVANESITAERYREDEM